MKRIISVIVLLSVIMCITSCKDSEENKKAYINNILDKEDKNDKETQKQTEKQTEEKTQEQTETTTRIIYFETNGGSTINPIDLNQYEGQMPITTKEGYDFLGWFTDKNLTEAVKYPYRPNGIVTVYAKWIKTKNQAQCKDFSLKLGIDMDSSQTFSITPNGFDIENLRKYGYKMKITVTYDFYYRKDYNVPLNIGYAGPPKYEIFIMNNDLMGVSKKDLETYESKETRSLEYITSAADLDNHSIYLTFSTDNIQNVIYFNNITVTYECFK